MASNPPRLGMQLLPALLGTGGTPTPTPAAVLSNPTGSSSAATTASGSVDTNQTGGTLYISVLPAASAAPSAAAFIAGTTGGVYTASTTSHTVGTNNFSPTGLTASTSYKNHYFQTNGNGNSNVVSSAAFSTTAAAGISNQTIPYGGLTLSNAGGAFALDNLGAEVSFVSVDSAISGSTANWNISGGRLRKSAAIAAAVLVCTTTLGQIQVTIACTGTDANGNDLAVSYSVKDDTELKAATELSTLSRGQNVLLRTGDYNQTQADVRTTRSVAIGGSSGFCTITPHVGAVPAVWRWAMHGTTQSAGWFWWKNVPFKGTNTGQYGGSAGTILLYLNSITDVMVTGCGFTNPATAHTIAAIGNIAGGILTGVPSITARITIDSCTFTNMYKALSLGGADITVTANTGDTFFTDFSVMSPPANNFTYKWNTITNGVTPYTERTITAITKGTTTQVTVTDVTGLATGNDVWFVGVGGMTQLNTGHPFNISAIVGNVITVDVDSTGFSNYTSGGVGRTTGVHGDVLQGNFGSATSGQLDGIVIVGNVVSDGQSNDGLLDGKQFFFLSDNSVDMNGIVVEGNTLVGTNAIGITLERSVNGSICNNTCVNDQRIDTGNAGKKISISRGSGNTVANNATDGINQNNGTTGNVLGNNNQLANNGAAYLGLFVAPTTAGPILTQYAVSSGIIGGQGTGRVNYGAKTTAIPPFLANASGTPSTTTTGIATVWTNRASGTRYIVVTTSATPPSVAQIKAGQNNTGSAAVFATSATVTTYGTQTDNITGLSAGNTYYVYYTQDVGALNSGVAAAPSFTTSAGSTGIAFKGGGFSNAGTDPTDISVATGTAASRTIIVVAALEGSPSISNVIFDPASENVTLTLVGSIQGVTNFTGIYKGVVSGGGTKTIRLDFSAAATNSFLSVYEVTGTLSNETVFTGGAATVAGGPTTGSQTIAASEWAIGGYECRTAGSTPTIARSDAKAVTIDYDQFTAGATGASGCAFSSTGTGATTFNGQMASTSGQSIIAAKWTVT